MRVCGRGVQPEQVGGRPAERFGLLAPTPQKTLLTLHYLLQGT